MTRWIRFTTACFVLALALLAGVSSPLVADDGTGAARHPDVLAPTGARPVRIDFDRFRLSGPAFADTTATAPPAHGWSSYSTAKKTWIIVGIAVGVVGIAAAVSNHGSSGGSGGGGY